MGPCWSSILTFGGVNRNAVGFSNDTLLQPLPSNLHIANGASSEPPWKIYFYQPSMLLDLLKVLGKSSKQFFLTVVKHGNESHGTISKTSSGSLGLHHWLPPCTSNTRSMVWIAQQQTIYTSSVMSNQEKIRLLVKEIQRGTLWICTQINAHVYIIYIMKIRIIYIYIITVSYFMLFVARHHGSNRNAADLQACWFFDPLRKGSRDGPSLSTVQTTNLGAVKGIKFYSTFVRQISNAECIGWSLPKEFAN